MKTFYPALCAFLFCSGTVFAGSRVEQETECALTLRVVAADGSPDHSTTVELLDGRDAVVARTLVAKGTARLCDFDFGVYSVLIGRNGCFPAKVSNITLVPEHPLALTIVINDCAKRPDHYYGCLAYLRVVDPKGSAIAGATVEHVPPSSRKFIADNYGRVTFPIGKGATTERSVSRNGFAQTKIRLSCDEDGLLERKVVLTPLR